MNKEERPSIVYRKRRRHKYRLMTRYICETGIRIENPIYLEFLSLEPEGLLTVEAGYCWDGPSGPAFDTRTFLRGSLIHDALYQLMREGLLDRALRSRADDLLKSVCLEDGMCRIRAAWVRLAARLFGGRFILPEDRRAP